MFLRQSTSQTIRFGPCLDITDGVTEETALTLAQADMRLSKDGGAFAQKNAAGNATHDSDGWYSTTLNTTDTDTVGELILNVHQPANTLPVWMRFYVVEEDVYDTLFASSGALTNLSVNVAQVSGDAAAADNLEADYDGTGYNKSASTIGTCTANTDMRGTDNAALASVLGALNDTAAAGDPTNSDTALQYLKQILNVLIGTAGVATFPAEAAPANAVSLAEVIRAIHADVTGLNGDAMRGTDSAYTGTPPTAAAIRAEIDSNSTQLAAIDTVVDRVETDTQDIQSRLPAALNNGAIPADVQRINDVEITGDGSTTPFDVP